MDTRGLRHLKAYLGDDAAHKAKAKRAADVVPVLAARKSSAVSRAAQTASGASSKTSTTATTTTTATPMPLSPSVMRYVESHLTAGATHKLSRTQMSLVETLAGVGEAATDSTATLAVTRGKVSTLGEMVDTVALAALELAARTHNNTSTTNTPPAENSSLFVLTEDAAMVAEVAQQLEGRYGLVVLRLADASAPRHPTFPSTEGGAVTNTKTSASSAKKAKKAKAAEEPVPPATAEDRLAAVVVVVASPTGFLAVDRRSAIWKFMGGFTVLLHRTAAQSGSLLSLLKGSEASSSSATPQSLNAQRWACLGHVPAIAIMAQEQAWLSLPEVDLLTTLSLEGGDAAVGKTLAASRRPVTVHYTVAEGTQRFQFLFSLLKGLVPHRGLVVHVATQECASFLYDALYAFVEELPSYVQILSDYEGASAYTNMHTSADRQRLCAAFDKVVLGDSTGEKTAAVLISCHGLVPRSGAIFLQYDIMPDVVNYSQFLAEVLTPGAVEENATAEVRREKTTRQRKRSVSPPPTPASARRAAAETPKGRQDGATSGAASATTALASYTHLLLLLRPNEVRGALARLRGDGAVRYRLDFHELPNKSAGRYLFIGEKLKSMNKKLFAIQNAAYYAYKATMRAYSTIGPRDVYDETNVTLEKVAEEFGYTELPLLDLRLKDTAFRPKEDFYRAARQKQEAERRAYKKFAADNIIPEEAETHVADVQEEAQ